MGTVTHRKVSSGTVNSDVEVDLYDWNDEHLYLGGSTGAVSRTAGDKLSEVFSVKDFGAVGDGSTDDTAAIQAAFDAAEALNNGLSIAAVYFPRSSGAYLISSTILATKSLCIFGDGPAASVILSSSNIPYFTLSAALNDMYDGEISGIGFLTGNSGTRTSEAAIKLIGANVFSYWTFENLHCLGVYRFFDWSTYTGGGSGWHTFRNNKARNSGALTVHDWMYFGAGVQGSLTIVDNVIYATANGIQAGNGTASVGDLVLSNNQFNSCADAINLAGGTSYGTNVQIVGNDFDAGVTNAITLDNMAQVVGRGNSFGGGTSIAITNSRGAGTTQSPAIHIERYEAVVVTITASQNNFNPTGMSRIGRMVIAANGDYNITGITAMQEDRRLEIYNGSAQTITLVDASGSSTAANRFSFGGTNFTLGTGATVKLFYNTSLLVWQLEGFGSKGILGVANGGTGLASGTSGGVPYYSSSSTIASSAALAANALVIGGGAGATPSTTTTASGILTFLGTPSSANLRSALTDETGTGAAVFAQAPVFVGDVTGPSITGTTPYLFFSNTSLGKIFEYYFSSSGYWAMNANGVAADVFKVVHAAAATNTLVLDSGGVSIGTATSAGSTNLLVAGTAKILTLANTPTTSAVYYNTSSGLLTYGGSPGMLEVTATAVNFNSANTDTAITVSLPTGYTRFMVFRATISHASQTLTTATWGLFSTTGGGGLAIVANIACTVSTASDATAANVQANGGATASMVAASLATPNTIYFRVGTAQGAPATADVTITILPLP